MPELDAVLFDPQFYEFLWEVDRELAQDARARGCSCGGVLHSADYRRKARGVAAVEHGTHLLRFSFCCAREGCRKRHTPHSLRFLGRRGYLAAAVVLISAMQQGLNPRRAAWLRERLGVSEKSLKRWRQWWTQFFPRTDFWYVEKGMFLPPCDVATLPASLLSRFLGPPWAQLLRTLWLLHPFTPGTPQVALKRFACPGSSPIRRECPDRATQPGDLTPS